MKNNRLLFSFLVITLLIACSTSVLPASSNPTLEVPITQSADSIPVVPETAGEHVTFKSGDLTLEGYLYKPAGDGSFPLLIWNHGSEQNPKPNGQFSNVASVFVPAGYVVFAPVRRGQGNSEGEYITDQVSAEQQKNGKASAEKLFVQLMTGSQLDDQLAGLAYAKSLPFVDQNRLAVAGCSFGGMQTIFGAESGQYKAAIALSPGAESWDGHELLQQRLIQAVDKINIPVLLIHPEHDASVEPGYNLGPEFQRLGKPY
jgi:carboxymethylenebutenolidase